MARLTIKNGKVGNELTRRENEKLMEDGYLELGEAIPFNTQSGTVYIKPRSGGNLNKKGVHLPLVLGHIWVIAKDDEGELVLVLKKT
jgi:hypothetical protein